MIFVTPDLGVAAEIADTVAVMCAGRIVESGPVARVLNAAAHPYTAGLLASTVHGQPQKRDIDAIPGSAPDLRRLPPGCSFAPRCPQRAAADRCAVPEPRFPDLTIWPRVLLWLMRLNRRASRSQAQIRAWLRYSVVLLRSDLPEVDTRLEWGHECIARRSERGNDGTDRAAAIADHKGVRNGPDRGAEIDRDKAGAVPIDRIAAGLPGSEVFVQAEVRTPIARVIYLGETAPAVKRTETDHNARSRWRSRYNSKNGKGVGALERRVRAP
jgi:oligopeptide/dipeptide ABC transporter ATP-binding protein